MFRLYEYICSNGKCSSNDQIKEILISDGEEPVCPECSDVLVKLISASKGYVKGTSTPCRNT
jgi:predicted nucleic acid-binding Zn ribbon protein